MKNKTRGHIFSLLLCALLCMALTVPLMVTAKAFDNSGGGTAIAIRITPPKSWTEESGAVEVRITDNAGTGFKNAYIKAGAADWRDVTAELERTENRWYCVTDVTENCTVHVRVTGVDGTVYEKSQFIQCFDTISDKRTESGDKLDSGTASAGVGNLPAPPVIPSTSPGGQGTVIDNTADTSTESGREFFTISSPDENIFYLVIDRKKGTENVYFLNAVTESDLMALAEKDKKTEGGGVSAIPDPAPVCSCKEKCAPGAVDTGCAVCILSWRDCTGTVIAAIEEPEQPKNSSGAGTILVVIVAALAAGGAGYYLKIYKPRKELSNADDLDDWMGIEDEQAVNEDNLPAAMSYQEPDEPDYLLDDEDDA